MTPERLQELADATESAMSYIDDYMVRTTAEQIVKTFNVTGSLELMPSTQLRIRQIEQSRELRDTITQGLSAKQAGIQSVVREVFERAASEIAQDQHEYTKIVADSEGIHVPTYSKKVAEDLTKKELRLIDSAYRRTNGTINNLTGTTADACQTSYINACDDAYLQIRGGIDINTAISTAIDRFSKRGIMVTYGNGATHSRIEVAIARAVRTGVNQANGDVSIARCAEMGGNFVLVSQHMGARVTPYNDYTNHSLWQGKVYMLDWSKPELSNYKETASERSENGKSFAFLKEILEKLKNKFKSLKYKDFVDTCGYGQLLGICGVNCRHTFSPFVPGVMKNTYKHIDTKENKQAYYNSQKARALERAMRETKRRMAGNDATDDADQKTYLKKRLKDQGEEYHQFCNDHNISMDNWRLKI